MTRDSGWCGSSAVAPGLAGPGQVGEHVCGVRFFRTTEYAADTIVAILDEERERLAG